MVGVELAEQRRFAQGQWWRSFNRPVTALPWVTTLGTRLGSWPSGSLGGPFLAQLKMPRCSLQAVYPEAHAANERRKAEPRRKGTERLRWS